MVKILRSTWKATVHRKFTHMLLLQSLSFEGLLKNREKNTSNKNKAFFFRCEREFGTFFVYRIENFFYSSSMELRRAIMTSVLDNDGRRFPLDFLLSLMLEKRKSNLLFIRFCIPFVYFLVFLCFEIVRREYEMRKGILTQTAKSFDEVSS